MKILRIIHIFNLIFALSLFTSCQKTPKAKFTVSSSKVFVGEKIEFTNTSQDAYHYYWIFDDKSTSTEINVKHIYQSVGQYDVQLHAYSKNRNKTDDFSISIQVDSLPPDPPPILNTDQVMKGVWILINAYNEANVNVTDTINYLFPTYVHLDDNNSLNSTFGPLFMYIVYGPSNYNSFKSMLIDCYNYSNLNLTEGEYFLPHNEVVSNFTIEIKQRYQTMESLTTILELIGINPPGLMEAVIYHRFIDVGISFEDNYNIMIWEWKNTTIGSYNIKDQYGNFVSWTGVSPNEFEKCKLYFSRSDSTLIDLINGNK